MDSLFLLPCVIMRFQNQGLVIGRYNCSTTIAFMRLKIMHLFDTVCCFLSYIVKQMISGSYYTLRKTAKLTGLYSASESVGFN